MQGEKLECVFYREWYDLIYLFNRWLRLLCREWVIESERGSRSVRETLHLSRWGVRTAWTGQRRRRGENISGEQVRVWINRAYLGVVHKIEGGYTDNNQVSLLSSWVDHSVIYWDGNKWGRNRLRRGSKKGMICVMLNLRYLWDIHEDT